MTAVVTTYILGEPNIALGHFIPMWLAYIIGGVLATFNFGVYLIFLFSKKFDKEKQLMSSK